jgi:uncharacterized protein (DUF58 family)
MPDPALFDRDFLRKLEYLHIVSKRVFAGQFRAERRARTRGAGLEFADHRAYAPGDDFRHVDWTAYQRLDKLLLRLFEEEQDLPIYLFVDRSRSMATGSPSKLAYARQVAAALCYVGLAHLDRVSLIAYSASIDRELPSQRGRGRIFKVFGFLGDVEPGGADTNTREAFTAFCSRERPRGVAVVISDFLDPGGFAQGLDILRFYRHDVFLVHVTSREELEPELHGEHELVDAETGDTFDLEVTPGLLAAYRHAVDRHRADLVRYCARHRFGYLAAPIEAPIEEAILRVFRQGRFLK